MQSTTSCQKAAGCGSKSTFVKYRAPNIEEHLAAAAKLMFKQRAQSDQRFCEVELKLADGQTDYVHAVLLAAHSNKFAKILEKNAPPISVDLSKMRARSVQRAIEYIYKGETQMCEEALVDHFIVAAYLDIPALKKQLEAHIVTMSTQTPERCVKALNAAADDRSCVSELTRATLVSAIVSFGPVLAMEELKSLSQAAIVALVTATHLTTNEKIVTVNLALEWLRIPANSGKISTVVEKLIFCSFNETDNAHFRADLEKCLLSNPTYVSIGRHENGAVIICNDEESHRQNCYAIVPLARCSRALSNNSLASMSNQPVRRTESFLKEMCAEIDDLPKNIFSKGAQVRTTEVVPLNRKAVPYRSNENLAASGSLRKCHTPRSQVRNETSCPRNASKSPVSAVSASMVLSESDVNAFRTLPDVFATRTAPSRCYLQPTRSTSQCEMIKRLPDVFAKDYNGNVPHYNYAVPPQRGPQSPGEYRPANSRSQALLNARNFTHSEVESIRNLGADSKFFPQKGHAFPPSGVPTCPQYANCNPANPCPPCPRVQKSQQGVVYGQPGAGYEQPSSAPRISSYGGVYVNSAPGMLDQQMVPVAATPSLSGTCVIGKRAVAASELEHIRSLPDVFSNKRPTPMPAQYGAAPSIHSQYMSPELNAQPQPISSQYADPKLNPQQSVHSQYFHF